jgi:WD40 repeat protein
MATGSYNSVDIYNATTFAKVASLRDESGSNVGRSEVRTIGFSPDGQRLALAKGASDISIWDLSEQVIIERLISGSGAEPRFLPVRKPSRIRNPSTGRKTVEYNR